MSVSTCAPCSRLRSEQWLRGPGSVHRPSGASTKKNNQANVFKPETKGYEAIQLLLCYFKTSLNQTHVFLLTAAIGSGLYDHFNNDNFIYEAHLKALTV